MRISSLLSGVFALAGAASALALPLTERDESSDLSSSGILSPTADTTWAPGQQVSITWYVLHLHPSILCINFFFRNTTEISSENGTLAVINLYNADDDYPTPVELASNFPSNTGSYNLTVPAVADGCYYIKSKL